MATETSFNALCVLVYIIIKLSIHKSSSPQNADKIIFKSRQILMKTESEISKEKLIQNINHKQSSGSKLNISSCLCSPTYEATEVWYSEKQSTILNMTITLLKHLAGLRSLQYWNCAELRRADIAACIDYIVAHYLNNLFCLRYLTMLGSNTISINNQGMTKMCESVLLQVSDPLSEHQKLFKFHI